MRIVFVGSVEFSRRTLLHLLTIGADVVGVCTKKISNFNADHTDLSDICKDYNLPCLYVDDINSSESISWIKKKMPDVIFCFGWSKLLKKDFLELAPQGIVGFHPAALPKNRGRHPLIWALALGLEKTASTFFFMDVGADSGDIISQREVLISQSDDAGSLYEKVCQSALVQINDFLPSLVSGVCDRMKQEEGQANSWRKRSFGDGKIDWRMSASSIDRLVRALSKPYVGADFEVNGQVVKLWKVAIVKGAPKNIEPGKIYKLVSSAPVVKCGEDAICLLSIEPSLDLRVGSYI
jgi:methionyl-tRNA formyltransferase